MAESSTIAIAHNAPFTMEWIMRIAAIGILVSGAVSFSLLPRRPQHVRPWTWLVLILQWALLPVTFILFGALPAMMRRRVWRWASIWGSMLRKRVGKMAMDPRLFVVLTLSNHATCFARNIAGLGDTDESNV